MKKTTIRKQIQKLKENPEFCDRVEQEKKKIEQECEGCKNQKD